MRTASQIAHSVRRRRHGRHLFAAVCTVVLLAAACGGSSSGEPVVDVEAPDVPAEEAVTETLEPFPTPTPAEPTPTPTPKPTPTPLPPPQSAEIRASGGTQRGKVNPYCWTPHRGGPSECYGGQSAEPVPLDVVSGEVALLVLDARIPPSEESIRAFQGSRSGYPANRIDPALTTELTLDLPPGEWSLDVCAAWYGHGEPICWLFRLRVKEAS